MATSRILAGLVAAFAAGSGAAEEPLSAIDWLSRSVEQSTTSAHPGVPVARLPSSGAISVAPIGGPTLDGLGLLASAKTGLPHDLWGLTPSADLARLLAGERVDTLPAMLELLRMMLLAETSPPIDADAPGALYLARVDKLLDMGSLEPALSLLELPQTLSAEPFRRRFDVALLLGEEDSACELMRGNPQVAPSFPARVFCLARGGDWNAAALSLRTGETLGFIEPDMALLLSRFLDPELHEGEPPLPLPLRPSPLVFRLREAIGEPMATATLPLAFAQADLRANTGWKTRLEAAERLARTGAIDPNQLLGLYTEREPAASGGIWDRVASVQALDSAIQAGDVAAVGRTLPAAWAAMRSVELEVPFATLYGERLARFPLEGEAQAIALRVGLLSPEYERIAARAEASGADAFLVSLARGRPAGAPSSPLAQAIRDALSDTAPPPETAPLLAGRRLGEALLGAIDDLTEGADGDPRDVARGLRTLRAAGLEGFARRSALQLLILERRG